MADRQRKLRAQRDANTITELQTHIADTAWLAHQATPDNLATRLPQLAELVREWCAEYTGVAGRLIGMYRTPHSDYEQREHAWESETHAAAVLDAVGELFADLPDCPDRWRPKHYAPHPDDPSRRRSFVLDAAGDPRVWAEGRGWHPAPPGLIPPDTLARARASASEQTEARR